MSVIFIKRNTCVIIASCLVISVCHGKLYANAEPAAVNSKAAYKVERFNYPAQPGRENPMAGVIAIIDLSQPQIKLSVALADEQLKPNDAQCVSTLDTPTSIARKNNFAITLNASFFAAPKAEELEGQKVHYFVGNCAAPVGWHVSSGKTFAKPANDKLRATLLIMDDGSVSIKANLANIPPKTRYAVSGNAMVLLDGAIVADDKGGTRHPRSVAGLSADNKTLYLVAVDGRQAGYSLGANMYELGTLLKNIGAANAINLDGGGSTAMVIKDIRTGAFALANQPSEKSTEGFQLNMERPVVDVIGVSILPPTALNKSSQK
jgi:Phosphodiester glycosidase